MTFPTYTPQRGHPEAHPDGGGQADVSACSSGGGKLQGTQEAAGVKESWPRAGVAKVGAEFHLKPSSSMTFPLEPRPPTLPVFILLVMDCGGGVGDGEAGSYRCLYVAVLE